MINNSIFPGERIIMDAHKAYISLPSDKMTAYGRAIVAGVEALRESITRGEYPENIIQLGIDDLVVALLKVEGEFDELKFIGE